MFSEGVSQYVLQVFARHSVVQVGDLHIGPIRERLGRALAAAARRRTTERRRAIGQARGNTPAEMKGESNQIQVTERERERETMKRLNYCAMISPRRPRALREKRGTEAMVQTEFTER